MILCEIVYLGWINRHCRVSNIYIGNDTKLNTSNQLTYKNITRDSLFCIGSLEADKNETRLLDGCIFQYIAIKDRTF